MTYIDVFISSAENKETLGKCISPHFPDGHDKWTLISRWAKSLGKSEITVDWGSYCYTVSKVEIFDCLSTIYRADPSYNHAEHMMEWRGSHYMVDKLDELTNFCSQLSENGSYAIVWAEW